MYGRAGVKANLKCEVMQMKKKIIIAVVATIAVLAAVAIVSILAQTPMLT